MSGDAVYRPRRSVLYMPGHNERALEKATTLPVDGLILDLEDAVAPDHKAAARDSACAAAASGRYSPLASVTSESSRVSCERCCR